MLKFHMMVVHSKVAIAISTMARACALMLLFSAILGLRFRHIKGDANNVKHLHTITIYVITITYIGLSFHW